MSWFKSKKSRQLETEKADIEREQFAQKAKSVEADMLEFLNAGIAFAQKQTNDAHRQIIANFVETLGKLAQLLFKNLEKKNKAQLFLLLPKMM
jgi:16S rRNA U516 pseudouridylate synthase RsuA-like enzyme